MKLLVCLVPLVSLVVCQSTNTNNQYSQDGTKCYVRGTPFEAGQAYQSLDGCNTCKCNPSGDDACTRKSCTVNFQSKKFPDTSQCQVNGQKYGAGERYPSPDGCNTCVCNPRGADACTYRACMSANNMGRNSNQNNWARTPGTGGNNWNMASWQGGNSNSNSWMNNFQNWFMNWMTSNPNWSSGFGNNYKGNSQEMMGRFRNWMMNQWMNKNQNIWNQWNNNQGNNNFEAMRQMFRDRIMADFINFVNGGNSNGNWNSNSWKWDWNNNNNRNWNQYSNWNQNQNQMFGNMRMGNSNGNNWGNNYQNQMMSQMRMRNNNGNWGNNWSGMDNNWNRNYDQQRMNNGYGMNNYGFGNNMNDNSMYGNRMMGMNGFGNRMSMFDNGMSGNNRWGMDNYGNSMSSNYMMNNNNRNRYDNMNQMNRYNNMNSYGNNMNFMTGGYSPANFYDRDVQKAYSFVEAHTNSIFNNNYHLKAQSADRVSKQTVNGINFRFEGLRFYRTDCPRDRSSEYNTMPWMSLSRQCQPTRSTPTTICEATVWWNPRGTPEYQVTQWKCSP